MNKELKDIKTLMESGVLTRASVSNVPLIGGWVLTFYGKKKSEIYVLQSQRDEGKPRTFKTIDAAANIARGLGFADMGVDLT